MAGRRKKLAPMNKLFYDALLWTFSVLVDLFFREVHPRGSWKVPRTGPVIFVAAPHANQFVDPLILMRVVRMEAHRRIAFLIAEKSMRRRFIGWFARNVGAVPVGRALDSTFSVDGKVYLPDPVNDPTLLRGVGTNFEDKRYQVGGLIVLPSVNNAAANAEILEVKGPEELRLKKPFKGAVAMRQLTGRDDITEEGKFENDDSAEANRKASEFQGTNFKIAPKVDQKQVYDSVFEKLDSGGCVGIFPEGGSHDRTELLPLKAGVAVMALGALSANPYCGLKIVPCGMNYFHAHKFRSRAVVEFGSPIEVPEELVNAYKSGEKREAVGQLLDMVYQSLVAVTVTAPDYDTLMLIQAVRRLYNPKGKKLPLPMIVELNRRLVKGYERYKDDPRILNLKKQVIAYNKQLLALNIRDHQVEYAKFSYVKVTFALFYRLSKLLILSTAVLPGLILFAPVFVAGKTISIKKSREALAASTVKIQAKDVVATWKLLVSMALAPALYTWYTCILMYWTHYNRVQGRIPESVPLSAIGIFGYIIFPAITYAALRFGEIGMDILKSLRPLLLALSPSSGNALVKLRADRASLATEVTELINTLGPEMFPDFESARIVADPFRDEPVTAYRHNRDVSESFSMDSSPTSPTFNYNMPGSWQRSLPRNESFGNLGNIALFPTRPTTPRNRSRNNSSGGLTGSSGFPVQAFSTLDSKENLDEVSMKIRSAMRERGQRRRSSGADGWEMTSGVSTLSESERKDK